MPSFLAVCLLAIYNIASAQNYCNNGTVPPACANLKLSNQYISCRAVNNVQQLFYNSRSQKFNDDGGWWNWANTVEGLINYCQLSNLCGEDIINTINEVTKAQTTRIQQGFDDIQWWSLTMIRLYEYKGDKTYLTKAQQFFDYVWQNAWDTSTCGGGLFWKPNDYKNAITNEQGLVNTAKLYKLTNDVKYRNEFNLLWNWFYQNGNLAGKSMINQQWLINDGMDSSNKQNCNNNHQTEWLYNQGVILGGLAEMYLIDNHNASFVDVSWNIIQSVMKNLVTQKNGINNILHEQESDRAVESSGDQSQFKGIFMRYLMYFYQNVILTDSTNKYANIKQEIISFVNNQMKAIYQNAMNPQCYAEFSAVWNASWVSTPIACVAQVSAVDAFNWAFILQN